MNDLEQNIAKLKAAGATPQEITRYIAEFRAAQPPKGTTRSWDEPGPPKVNPIEGMARAANQGLSFGFGDEISAGIGAGIDKLKGQSFGESYKTRVAGERNLDRQFKSDHPVLGYGSEIGGAVLNGAMIPGLGKLGAVKGGAALGGAYGVGASEGGLQNRAIGAGLGAVTGGLGGAAIEGAAKIASPMVRAVAAKLSPGSKVGQALAKRGVAVGPQEAALSDAHRDILAQLKRGQMSLDAVSDATSAAHPDAMLLDVAGDPMLRRARGVHAIPSKGSADIHTALTERVAGQPSRVQDKVSQAITGRPRENAVQTARQLVDARKNAAKPLYDEAYGHGAIQNPEVQRHIDELRKFPAFSAAWKRGLMNDALEASDPSLPAWAREEVPDWKGTAKGKPSGTARLNSGGLRSPGQMADDELLGEIERLTMGQTMDQASVDAIPGHLLDESKGLRSLGMSEDANGLVRGDERSGAAMSQNRADQRQKSLDRLYAEAEKRGLFQGNASEWADEAGEEIASAPKGVTLRHLDAWKKGLDATIESGRGSTNALSRNEARLYRSRLEDVLKMADDEVPAYGKAREQFAGDSRLMEAHESGQSFANIDRDELAEMWNGFGQGERELFRRGVLSDLSTRLSKVADGRDVTRMFQNPLMREKLSIILPDEQAGQKFLADLAEETRLHKNSQTVLSGSPTARIEAEKADGGVSQGMVEMVTRAASGNPSGAVSALLKRLVGPQEVRGLTEAKADALAPMLTAKGEKMRALIEELKKRSAATKAAGVKRGSTASVISRPLGLASGRQQ